MLQRAPELYVSLHTHVNMKLKVSITAASPGQIEVPQWLLWLDPPG